MEMREFLQRVKDAYSSSAKAVIATIIEIKMGEMSPDLVGAKMLLVENRKPFFTSGDLASVYQYLLESNTLVEIMDLKEPVLRQIETGEGKLFEIFFEPLVEKPRLVIFGAGHIALPLASLGKLLDFEVLVVDDRQDFVNRSRFPEADGLFCQDFNEFLSEFTVQSSDYLVIVTRGHQFDYFVLREVIKSPARYIGMIGSRRKVKIIFDELRNKDGIADELIAKVYSPIGLDIGAETPEEIAVAIAGEIIKVRREINRG